MKTYLAAVNIDWDTDSDEELEYLPKAMLIPEKINTTIGDYLTEKTGFCHKGFELIEVQFQEEKQ